jgi:hypothetical protein
MSMPKRIKSILYVVEIIILIALSLAFLVDLFAKLLPENIVIKIKENREKLIGLFYGFLAFRAINNIMSRSKPII